MSGPSHIERRDPAAGILKLGTVLTDAFHQRLSGDVLVRDNGLAHTVQLVKGHIAEVALDNLRASRLSVPEQVSSLFVLERPHVLFEERSPRLQRTPLINPRPVVAQGVSRRRDLFDPTHLVERIPVEVLRIKPAVRQGLAQLGLSPDEITFIEQLTVPTPTPMALWKRGLAPGHAGAIVMALNLIGAFEAWRPGDLPRLTAVNRLRRMIQSGRSDHELLGIDRDASVREVDRAFRKLSLVLHPDRFAGLSGNEADRAEAVFVHLNRAHDRIKRSRRSRRTLKAGRWDGRDGVEVIHRSRENWATLLEQAERAARAGNHLQARRFSVKALALSPPATAVDRLKAMLRRVA